ncbi:Uncharacterized protein MLTONO_0380 [Mesorhizobium loti]|nr:Uncharacterized protein MLTONO_0380 [Mesorhizobium loti]
MSDEGHEEEVETVLQGVGWTIAKTKDAGTMVPYPARPILVDGRLNYGWMDLRGRPDLVEQIPEARESPALSNLLRVIATSPMLMSSACEHASFDRSGSDGPAWQAGAFIIVEFLEAEKNTDPGQLIEFSKYVLGGIPPTELHHIGFEMIVEPLKYFFGRRDCHALMMRPLGYGSTEGEALAALEFAVNAIADSIQRNREVKTP